MGRWTQRQRSASGGQPSGATPSVVSVVDEGSGLLAVTFSRPITENAGGVPDSVSLQLDGVPVDVTSVSSLGFDSVEIQQALDPAAGATFVLVSQPSWLVTRVATSQPTLIS